MIYEFVVKGKPQGKCRPRITTRGKFAHAYTPKATVEYEQHIRNSFECVYGNPSKLSEAPITMVVDIRFGIPTGTNKANKELMLEDKILPTKKPDADNVIKSISDALNGYLYKDDAQIIRLSVRKMYALEPSVKVVVITHE